MDSPSIDIFAGIDSADIKVMEVDNEWLVYCSMGGIALKVWKAYQASPDAKAKGIRVYAQDDDGEPSLFGQQEATIPRSQAF
jgi:hypothetical protein